MTSLLLLCATLAVLFGMPPVSQELSELPPYLSSPRLAELYRFDREGEAGEQPRRDPVFTASGRHLVFRASPIVAIDLDSFRLVRLPVEGEVFGGWDADDILVRTGRGFERWDLGTERLIEELPSLPLWIAVAPTRDRYVGFGEFLVPDTIVGLDSGRQWELARTFGMTSKILWHPSGESFVLLSRRSYCSRGTGGELAQLDSKGRLLRSWSQEDGTAPREWAYSPGGGWLLVAHAKGLALRDGSNLELLREDAVIAQGVAFLDERRALVLEDRGLTLWHPASLTRVSHLLDCDADELVVSPDRRHLVLASEEGERIFAIID